MIIAKDGKLLLLREYRYELKREDYRLPGGKVFDALESFVSFQGDILNAAEDALKKEAEEEAGILVEPFSFLGKSLCGATIEWDLYYFEVSQFKQLPSQKLE